MLSSIHHSCKLLQKKTLITPFITSIKSSYFRFSTNTSTGEPGFINVSIEEAHTKTSLALEKIGWDKNDANLQADIMVNAELCGNNQGLVKMYQPALTAPAPQREKPHREKETMSSAVLNGNQSPGMLAAVMAADLAVEKVLSDSNQTAISVVSTYNTSTSSGQLGYYVNRMAQSGLIGLGFANSPEFVAAAPGGLPVFGTNPLAVGMPYLNSETKEREVFTFDMATSAIALYGVLTAKAKDMPLPDQVAYDKQGNWTTDASTALGDGSIATFGGHKGAGLSLCVELLAGALSGSAVLGQCESKKLAKNWGHLFIAIQPNLLVEDFDTKVSSVLETVKSSGDNVRIPGENSSRMTKMRREADCLPIPEKIWETILYTAEHGLNE